MSPILYLLFAADLPTRQYIVTTTTVLTIHQDSAGASILLQNNLNLIKKYTKKCHVKIDENKSQFIVLDRGESPIFRINNQATSNADCLNTWVCTRGEDLLEEVIHERILTMLI